MLIFVANLPLRTRSKELAGLFSAHGVVSNAYLICDKVSHRSKGFGFVQMDNEEEAQAAIKALNESMYNDRELHVAPAKGPAQPKTENTED